MKNKHILSFLFAVAACAWAYDFVKLCAQGIAPTHFTIGAALLYTCLGCAKDAIETLVKEPT